MSNIRVTYSGLISLLVSLSAVITGTIFVVMITRKLSPEELGTWTLITNVVSYALIIEPIISYWTARQIARGEKVSKTSVFTSSIFSIGGLITYFIISFFLSGSLRVDLSVLLLASFLVPLSFLQSTLSSVCLSYKPHSISFSTIAFETSKIPLGLIFVVFLPLGTFGAILTIILANILRMSVLLFAIRQQLVDKIIPQIIKFWIRMSWLPMYSAIPGFILTLDVLIFSSLTHSLVGLAYWTAGLTVAALIYYSGNISQALYPKLIATGKKEYAEENLKRTMYLAIPLFALTLILAKPVLSILNPIYSGGVFIVYFLALKSFTSIFAHISFNIISAFESVDVNKNASFKQYLKSKLFFIPTLNYIMSGSYVILLSLFLIFRNSQMTDIQTVSMWSFISFTVIVPFTIYSLILIRRHHKIVLPYKAMLKFTATTILASIPVFFLTEKLQYTSHIWNFLPPVMEIAAVGAVIYFGITYVIDQSTRKLFKSIFYEMRKK